CYRLFENQLLTAYNTSNVNNVHKLHTYTVLCKEESNVEKCVKALKEEAQKAVEKPVIVTRHPFNETTLSINKRELHTGTRLKKEESIVEQAVKALKEEKDVVKEKDIAPAPAPEAAIVKPTLWHRFVAEVKHYYNGFRLLFVDIKIACRMLWGVLNGKSLSRRERKQLVRTTADMFRLVPFLIFVIVPFMEFFLPVALKLFPGMLPSTFKEEKKEQEKIRKKLKVKLEMAKFLQETIEDSAVRNKQAKGDKVEAFASFLDRIQQSGSFVATDEIVKYSKVFEDEITLDNLSRAQLIALCKVLEIAPIGTNNFLRFQLRMKLRELKADDKMIQKEGIDSLTVNELQAACRARGMRALGVPVQRLKLQLDQWIDIHLNEKIPTSLLLLSRALFLTETVPTEDVLKETISALPESTAQEAKIKVAEVSGEKVDNTAKLELIRQEEEAIKREQEEMKETEEREEREAKLKEESERAAALAAEEAAEVDEALRDTAPRVMMNEEEELIEEVEKEEEISAKDLEEIESALENIAEEKNLKLEQDELEHLKEDVSEYQEDLQDLKEIVVASGGNEKDVSESKVAKRLSKRVDKMLQSMGSLIDQMHAEKEGLIEEIEVKEVRVKRSQELRDDMEKRQEVLDFIEKKRDNVITINELVLAMRRIQKVPDDMRIQKIAEVLDADHDGEINVDDVMKVIDLLGQENVKINTKDMSKIIELLRSETEIEEEEKCKEKEEKEANKLDDKIEQQN
ncbi:unnamed protein product, partial [Owenia fusiformis]